MTGKRRGLIGRGTSVVFLGNTVAQVLFAILFVLAARQLGASQFGYAVAGYGLGLVWTDVANAGFASWVLRAFAIHREYVGASPEVFRDATAMRRARYATFPLFLPIAILTIEPFAQRLDVACLWAAFALVRTVNAFYLSELQAALDFVKSSMVIVVERATALLAFPILAHVLSGSAAFAAALLLGAGVSTVLVKVWRPAKFRAWPSGRRSGSFWSSLAASYREPSGFAVSGLTTDLLLFDASIISKVASAGTAGIYGIGARLTGPFTGLGTAYATAQFPRLQDHDNHAGYWRGAVKICVATGAGLAICALLARPVVPRLFGNSYQGAVTVVVVFCVFAFLSTVGQMASTFLQATGHVRVVAMLTTPYVAAVLLAVAFGSLWDGARGAAVGTLLSQTLLTLGLVLMASTRRKAAAGLEPALPVADADLVRGLAGGALITAGGLPAKAEVSSDARLAPKRVSLAAPESRRSVPATRSVERTSPSRPRLKEPRIVGSARPLGMQIVFFVLLGVVVPFLIFALTSRQGALVGFWPLTLFIILYAAWRLSSCLFGTTYRLLSAAFWTFAYVSFGVAEFCQICTGLFPFLVDSTKMFAAEVIVVVGLLAFELGQYFVIHRRDGRNVVATIRVNRVLSEYRLWVITWLAFAASSLYVARVGFSPFFSSRSALAGAFSSAGLRGSAQGSSQVFSAFTSSFGTVPALVALAGWNILAHQHQFRRPSVRIARIGLTLLNLVVNNPISNSRNWFITVVFVLVFSLAEPSLRRVRVVFAVGVAFAIFLFPYSDFLRKTDVATQSTQVTQSKSIAQELATKDYDQTTMTANGVWFAGEFGHTDGRQLLGSAFFFVPHSVWPERANDTGVLIASKFNAVNQNLSSPLWIELWLDLGWPGLVVGMGVLGAVIRMYERRYASSILLPTLWVGRIGVPAFAGYEFIILRGPLLEAMSRLSILLAVVAFSGVRSKASASLRGAAGRRAADRPLLAAVRDELTFVDGRA